MRRQPRRTASLALTGLLLCLVGWAAAQGTPTRVVLLPFDADRSIEAYSLGFPTALQRALNEIDGVYVPPIGDAGVVLQRALIAGGDALSDVARVFAADAVVLARIVGRDALSVEVVVVRGGEEVSVEVSGSGGDLPALWKDIADAIVVAAGLSVGSADRVALRRVLDDAPSLPSLGPLALASSRLPGVRLDQLENAAALDEGSAWVRSELARLLALDGRPERARSEALAAVELLPGAETLAVLGVVLLAQGDEAAARSAFRDALASNPHHAVALVGLAQASATATERGELLERAIAASPRLVDAHLAIAETQTSPTRVVQALRRASGSLPDSPAVQGTLIEVALESGDPRGALDLLRAAVADPIGRSSAVYALAGRLPAEVREGALALVREGIERFPEAGSLRRVEVDLLRRGGDNAGALAALRLWVDTGNASIGDAVDLAETLASLGAVDEAHALLATVADLDADADLRSARIDLAAGRARAAAAALEPRIAAGDTDPLARALYGIALGRIGRSDEAAALLTAVVAEGESDVGDADAAALARRALSVLQEQRLVGGADAIALEGEAGAAFQQGLYALETGDLVGARDAFVRARAAQDVGIIAFYHGYVLQLLGDPRGAIAAYQAARGDLGANDVLLNNLGYAHLQVGRLDLALETLRLSVEANPGNARAHLNLGLAHYGLARFRDAVASFDTALGLDPSLATSAGPTIEDARRRAAP